MTAPGLLPSPPRQLAERGWRIRLHAGAAPPSVVAAARRALRVALAAPGAAAVGFALFRPDEDGWALPVHTWHGGELRHEALLLPDERNWPRRCPALARGLRTADDVMFLSREAAAWRRQRGDADGAGARS